MKLFKPYTYTWWQIGIFKMALLSVGAIIGSYWHVFFQNNLTVFVIIAIIGAGYIWYVSLKK